MKRIAAAAVIFLLLLLDSAFAGNNASFAVSCTIPAIPGVNVALLEQEQIETKPVAKPQEKTPEQAQEIMQQDSQTTSTNTQAQVLVKTFYAR